MNPNNPDRKRSCRKNWLLAALILTLAGAVPGYAAATAEFVRNVAVSNVPSFQRRALVREEFKQEPFKLADVVKEIDMEQEGAIETARLARDGMSDLLRASDYLALLERISEAGLSSKKGFLAEVLPRNVELVKAVGENPKPVIDLLRLERESLKAVAAYGEVLAAGNASNAVPIIKDKLRLEHINESTARSLDASLIRLRDNETLSRYAAQVTVTNDFSRLREALDVFAQSRSPRVLKHLAAWLDRTDYPPMPGHRVDPPWRYADVACHFIHHFQNREAGPISLVFVPRCSPAQIQEAKSFWERVKNEPEYQ